MGSEAQCAIQDDAQVPNSIDFLKGCVVYEVCGLKRNPLSLPQTISNNWESYVFNGKEYILHNLGVKWENAEILCRGYHNGSLAILDKKEIAEFLAEALSESQFDIDSIWVGARRDTADDPEGYRWAQGVELKRTDADVLTSELAGDNLHYPIWVNRTGVPVPEGGADCVALERVQHDRPVFLDLPCGIERPFSCEREARADIRVRESGIVRCRSGLYHVYSGQMDWHQAATHCIMNKMSLATINSMKCLKKLGLAMLKARPSIENAWIGAKGRLGNWTWIDTGASIIQPTNEAELNNEIWPPLRDRNMKQSGCLQLDRHSSKSPLFLEARCERKMQFICYKGLPTLRLPVPPPSDDLYYYILVQQKYYWQHAFDNCRKMNGSLASVESNDVLIQLLLVMGENKNNPVEHIWVSGHLNITKDIATDAVTYAWYNPSNGKRLPDPKSFADNIGLFMPPWLDTEFTMDAPCLNLDRQNHLSALVYGLACDTPQYSICMIGKILIMPFGHN
ncbi:uncharacterized protein LOC114245666 [Bombyx mandarina]|uniref:Uncharacterized protein LOC114245666 n=1 Tax=Bombyx mandarina TaxID=7092 RepID=A0A6J2JV50_BOMMA|nr:uncharacterized protein LOC114245666 [Bombyx mandarina]